MNRLLTFHIHETSGNEVRMAPSAYYLDGEYDKVAVRIYAEKAPVRDAQIDIFDDGVSIFSNRTSKAYNPTSGEDITGEATTTVTLPVGENSEEIAENFTTDLIKEGSWVYCNLVDSGGGYNFTVQLELSQMSEGNLDEESEDD